ncbi:MAG: translesion error-prone DNA polymerase V autoproteolytic subunit [Bacteroidales bacterium]
MQNDVIVTPMAASGVSAGFPSPAEDYLDGGIDLNKYLIRNPSSTFFVRVDGESMKDEGINNNDLLVVDKSVEPYNGCIAVCYIGGEFTLKRVLIENGKVILMPANNKYKPIVVKEDDEFVVWGVVRYSIKKH